MEIETQNPEEKSNGALIGSIVIIIILIIGGIYLIQEKIKQTNEIKKLQIEQDEIQKKLEADAWSGVQE